MRRHGTHRCSCAFRPGRTIGALARARAGAWASISTAEVSSAAVHASAVTAGARGTPEQCCAGSTARRPRAQAHRDGVCVVLANLRLQPLVQHGPLHQRELQLALGARARPRRLNVVPLLQRPIWQGAPRGERGERGAPVLDVVDAQGLQGVLALAVQRKGEGPARVVVAGGRARLEDDDAARALLGERDGGGAPRGAAADYDCACNARPAARVALDENVLIAWCQMVHGMRSVGNLLRTDHSGQSWHGQIGALHQL